MNNKILKKYMMSFSTEQLKKYLGEDLLEALFEWQNDSEAMFTKSKLSEMIITINGLKILKQKDFRQELIKKLEPEKIISFKKVLPKKFQNITDLKELALIISQQPWKKSAVSKHLLEILGYDEDFVFEEKQQKGEVISSIQSHEKFYELLDYQYIIRQKALTKLNSEEELVRMLIHMPTGTGKTKTATHIACHHYNYNLKKKGLIIWIAHTTELLQQAYNTFCSVWKNIGNGEINTYKLWGNYDIEPSMENLSGFMVCSIQKLYSISTNNPQLFERLKKEVKLIIYDEAHKASAPESRKIINEFMIKKSDMEDRALMGLSATPGRSNGISFDNKLLASTFGGCIIGIDTRLMNSVNYSPQVAMNMEAPKDIIKYFQDRRVLSKVSKEELVYDKEISEEELKKIKIQTTANGYDDFSKSALEVIGKNKNRNLKILEKLRELNEKKIPTIVFACSVKHGQLLSSMLSIEGIKNVLVIGDMPAKERADAIKKFKDKDNDINIIINYEVLTTGFDSTNIQCVFIARPTQSIVLYSQMIGRGLRGPLMGGNEICLLVDVKDNLEQYNENMAFSHFNNYWKEN